MKQFSFSLRADILSAIIAYVITKDIMIARFWFAAFNLK